LPKLVDRGAQRRDIRSAARRAFARRGVGAGLAHVADEAGMGRTSLYHYYPDKRALVRDLLRDVLAEEESLFAAAHGAEGPPLARIEALMRRLVASFDAWEQAGRMLLDLRLRDTGAFRSFFRRIRRHLAGAIAEGQQSGEMDRGLDAELAAATLIGAVDGLLLQHFADRRAFPDRRALEHALVETARRLLAP